MPLPSDVPPTAGLPARWRDFLPARHTLGEALAGLLGIPQPIPCCSGTAALVVALTTIAAGSARRTVIVPAYSCPLVIQAIAHCGLQAKICDTAEGRFDFDLAALDSMADEQTLAILTTHLGGRCADAAAARAIAHRVGAMLIEDAAQGLGARKGGITLGLIGDIGFFSLAAGKGLTTFEGGVLFSAVPELHARLAEHSVALLPKRRGWELRRCLEFLGYALFYRPRLLPYVYGIPYRRAVRNEDWLSAAGERFAASIPLHALGTWRQHRAARASVRLPAHLRATAATARMRRDALEDIGGLRVLGDAAEETGTWPFFMMLCPNRRMRDAALAALAPLGFGVGRLFVSALNDYADLAPHFLPEDRSVSATPHARDFAGRLLTVSNSPFLSDAAFAVIVEKLRVILADHRLAEGG